MLAPSSIHFACPGSRKWAGAISRFHEPRKKFRKIKFREKNFEKNFAGKNLEKNFARARKKFGKFFRIGEEIFRGDGVLEISKGCVKENEKHRGGREKIWIRAVAKMEKILENFREIRKIFRAVRKFFRGKKILVGPRRVTTTWTGRGAETDSEGGRERKNRKIFEKIFVGPAFCELLQPPGLGTGRKHLWKSPRTPSSRKNLLLRGVRQRYFAFLLCCVRCATYHPHSL